MAKANPSDTPIMPTGHRLVKAVSRSLRQRCGLHRHQTLPGTRILVATSGGADSVALLRALAILAPRRTWRLYLAVGHVQHHLRPDAEADADFVAQLAATLSLPCLRADLSPEVFHKRNMEAAARHARYDALAQMARACAARYIITAHQADDQLETLLMRVLRGSSVRGLRGIAWRRRLRRGDNGDLLILRPMLAVTRTDVRSFLTALGQPWREDHTNADLSRRRARLRHDVLPILADVQPDVPHKAVALADHLRRVGHLVDQAIDHAADRVSFAAGTATLDRLEARALPVLVLSGLLRRLLTEAGVAGDRLGRRTLGPIVRAVRDTAGGVRTFDLAGGVQVRVTRASVAVG